MILPIKDEKTITASGELMIDLLEGVSLYDGKVHVDERGSVCEMFNPDWGWNAEPMTYAYYTTVRPGKVKGWGVHELHEDRYFIVTGELEVVLYDDRPDSSTYRRISKIFLTDQKRQAINIPARVYHAIHNIGLVDALVCNFPTRIFDRENPDKHRLPIDTDLIPYSFGASSGW